MHLIVGAPKCGTTALYHYLRQHPQIFMPERKELHFFDNKWDRPLREYARHFEGAGGRVKGEITPAYGILPPERIRYLRRVMSYTVIYDKRLGRKPKRLSERMGAIAAAGSKLVGA